MIEEFTGLHANPKFYYLIDTNTRLIFQQRIQHPCLLQPFLVRFDLGDKKTKDGEMNCFGSFFLLPSVVFLLSDLISLLIHVTALIIKRVMHASDYLHTGTV